MGLTIHIGTEMSKPTIRSRHRDPSSVVPGSESGVGSELFGRFWALGTAGFAGGGRRGLRAVCELSSDMVFDCKAQELWIG